MLAMARQSEVIMWLVMRGALSANVTETWRDYYLPSMTGIATHSPQLGIFAKGHFGKLFRVINQHVNKLGIPVGIIKAISGTERAPLLPTRPGAAPGN
jgi:hypothetical protein